MYKLLYVLVSSEKDLYCEQCILSIMSAKRNSPRSKITLLIDDVTKTNIESHPSRKQIFDLVDECVSIRRPAGFSGMESSRYLKTSMRKYVRGDFLYIDSDTIVCDSLDDVDEIPYELAAVLDQHMPLSQSSHAINFRRYITKVSGSAEPCKYDKYFNSGVIWARDTESNRKFFEDWNEIWLNAKRKGIKLDQPSLAFANYKNKYAICEIDGTWNCQVWFAANYLAKAKIIHYFASIDNAEGGYNTIAVDLPKKIKQGEPLSDEDWGLIQGARSAFPSPNAIITGADYEIFKSSLCGVLRAVYKRKNVFNFFENLLYVARVLRSKLLFEKR